LLSIILISCEKEETGIVINTGTVETVTSTSITLNGKIISSGSGLSAFGYITSTDQSFGSATSYTMISNPQPGNHTLTVMNLIPGTNYYIKAYASNSSEFVYGEVITQMTLAVTPSVNTMPVGSVNQTSATIGGNVISDGGFPVTVRGICWSKQQQPLISGNKAVSGGGLGQFSCNLTNLEPGTTYYARAFAVNAYDTAYGNQVSFTTGIITVKPEVSTSVISNITTTTAQAGGNVSSDGGASVTERGVCWSINEEPTTLNNKVQSGEGTGTFTCEITDLLPNTTYFARAYAINAEGTSYGSQVQFTTNREITAPVIVTSNVSSVTSTSAIGGGTITDDGGSEIIERGICWCINQYPTAFDNKATGSSVSGQFSVGMTGLLPNTNYYIRAYAINSIDTAYGSQVSFTTLSPESGSFTDSRDGISYKWIRAGKQIWMAENLAYLPYVSPSTEGSSDSEKYYVYDYEGTNVEEAKTTDYYKEYGVLYNHFTAQQGVCPIGWHLPIIEEWDELINYWTGTDEAGGKLKETGTTYWESPNTGATNQSEFTALPAGKREFTGGYNQIGKEAYFWTDSQTRSYDVFGIYLTNNSSVASSNTFNSESGFSVRCVKDSD